MVISANGVKYSWEYLRSFLGSLNIFMKDIFFLIQGAYIYNFADKNSFISTEDSFKEGKTTVKSTSKEYY